MATHNAKNSKKIKPVDVYKRQVFAVGAFHVIIKDTLHYTKSIM